MGSRFAIVLGLVVATTLLLTVSAGDPKLVDEVPPEDGLAGGVTPEDDYDPAKHAKDEFAQMDTNKDGKADMTEVQAYMRKEFYNPEFLQSSEEKLTEDDIIKKVAEDAKEYLGEIDTDKDNALTEEEIVKHYTAEMEEPPPDNGDMEGEVPDPTGDEAESAENMAVGDDPDAPIESDPE